MGKRIIRLPILSFFKIRYGFTVRFFSQTTVDQNNDVRIWDVKTGEEEQNFPSPCTEKMSADKMACLHWCKDDSMAAILGDHKLILIDLKSGDPKLTQTEDVTYNKAETGN